MYEIENKVIREAVAKNLKQAQVLVDNAIAFLKEAKKLAPDERYLGYDVDDRIYQCRRLASDIGEHVNEATATEDESL